MFFRRATSADADAMKDFEWKVPAEDISAGDVYIAGVESTPQGFAIFNRTFFNRPWIAVLFVHESHRRHGVARALIQGIEEFCANQKLFTSTSLCNVAMQSLLNQQGFKLTGVIENLGPQPELVYFKLCSNQRLNAK
jgi:GNAT superfamily N-acetyltransferase